jgi:thiamine-monophosphate kinase
VALGQALWRDGLATAAADVSDGLIADLGHICRQSGVGARLAVPKIPLSAAVQRRAELDADVLRRAVTGGDDYELVFTAPANHATAIAALATRLDLPLTCIGEIVDGTGVALHDAEGAELPLDTAGWTHF